MYISVTILVILKEIKSIRFYPYPIFKKAVNCCFNNTVGSRRTVITIDEGNIEGRIDKSFKGLPNLRSVDSKTPELMSAGDPLAAIRKSYEVSPSPTVTNTNNNKISEDQKAYACSQLQCPTQETSNPVCACNFNTGNTVTFKNECDLKKHNCRFDTGKMLFIYLFVIQNFTYCTV